MGKLGSERDPKSKFEKVRQAIKEHPRGLDAPGPELKDAILRKYGISVSNNAVFMVKKQLRQDARNLRRSQSVRRDNVLVHPSPLDKGDNRNTPEQDAALITGEPFKTETGEAPLSPESSEMAKNYQEGGQLTEQSQTEAPALAQQLEVKSPVPETPTQQAAQPQGSEGTPVDLRMFSSLPAILEDGLFKIPAIKNFTGGYEMDEEDKKNIEVYTTALLQKHSGAIVTKNAEELNFVGAISVPWIKATQHKIVDALAERERKKKEKAQQKIEDAKAKQQVQEKVLDAVQKLQEVPAADEDPAAKKQREYQKMIDEANSKVANTEAP